ncbi:hypothetical protein [Hymenobacter sp. GOD-10R]|uniref:hypothetical protein n=1 Tax=Hymenobacter sp. GOD-10R TaxID=3093922 RepID=UPI002D797B54|nr:hypothetical protein [Hymenobacter sp. GOD-10R]WRQ27307.1 hypothetical protein SD425_19735 [Hymenobacter sp. GOD-10R]
MVTLTLASCKKDDVLDDMIIPKTSITFNDNIETISADYNRASTLTLKISGVSAASNVQITSTYSVSGTAKAKDLGTLPVADGVATLSVPATALRNTADGAVVGATATGTGTASRANNSYVLQVNALLPDGTSERRLFTAVLTQ